MPVVKRLLDFIGMLFLAAFLLFLCWATITLLFVLGPQ